MGEGLGFALLGGVCSGEGCCFGFVLVFRGAHHRCMRHQKGAFACNEGFGRTSEIIKSNPVLLTSMTKVVHGTVHKGMIKPVDMLEENEEVLIIRVQKPKKSTIDMIAKKPREMLNHSSVEEIIESTESGEGID